VLNNRSQDCACLHYKTPPAELNRRMPAIAAGVRVG
jgi:hypothetical protein